RVEVEVGAADGLLDHGQDLGVPGLDRDQRGIGDLDVANLVDRRRRPVLVDPHAVQHAQRGAAGAHDRELAADGLERGVHPLLSVGDHLLDRHDYSSTIVPTLSPRTIRLRFPISLRLYTMIGRALSMHKEMAVVSITLRPFCSTSK